MPSSCWNRIQEDYNLNDGMLRQSKDWGYRFCYIIPSFLECGGYRVIRDQSQALNNNFVGLYYCLLWFYLWGNRTRRESNWHKVAELVSSGVWDSTGFPESQVHNFAIIPFNLTLLSTPASIPLLLTWVCGSSSYGEQNLWNPQVLSFPLSCLFLQWRSFVQCLLELIP